MGDESGIILVIGQGAIGIMATTAIGRGTDRRLFVVAKPNAAARIKEDGLHRCGVLGNVSLPPERIEVFDSLGKVPEVDVDQIAIAVKCPQVVGEVFSWRLCARVWPALRGDSLFNCKLQNHDGMVQVRQDCLTDGHQIPLAR